MDDVDVIRLPLANGKRFHQFRCWWTNIANKLDGKLDGMSLSHANGMQCGPWAFACCFAAAARLLVMRILCDLSQPCAQPLGNRVPKSH